MKFLRNFSIRKQLIGTILSFILLGLTTTYISGFLSARKQVGEVFDNHLIKSSKLILGLIHHEIERGLKIEDIENLEFLSKSNSFLDENKIHFQAWKEERMVYSSSNMIMSRPKKDGFYDEIIGENEWHGFALQDQKSQITIISAEESGIRTKLLHKILASLFIPIAIFLIPILLIVPAIIDRIITPIHTLSNQISKISSQSLDPIRLTKIPSELQPLIDSFNSLLFRLKLSIESERMFADYAAHELKTPLAAIKIQAQLIAQNKDRSKNQEYVDDLVSGVKRASNLISQLLLLARIESDIQASIEENELIGINDMINDILHFFLDKINEKKIDIELKSDESVRLVGNRSYLEILLQNLIDNALKYSNANSKITILFRESQEPIKTMAEGGVEIEITNQGAMLSEVEVSKIFDHFFRANHSPQENGSGLGLAICKKIAFALGGDIKFSSNKHGQNCATLTLPNAGPKVLATL